MFLGLFVDSATCSKFHKDCSKFRKLACFWRNLSGTVFYLFVCGIHNKEENQRKVAALWIWQKFWFWPVAEFNYNSQNSQFGHLMERLSLITKPVYMALKSYECSILTNTPRTILNIPSHFKIYFFSLLLQVIMTKCVTFCCKEWRTTLFRIVQLLY